MKGEGQAKVWLTAWRLAKARGFAEHELNRIRKTVEERRDEFLRAWHEHFGG